MNKTEKTKKPEIKKKPIRDAQTSKYQALKRRVVYFIDSILEKISITPVRIAFIVLNILLLALFINAIFMSNDLDSKTPKDPSTSKDTDKDGEEEVYFEKSMIDQAIKDATVVRIPQKTLKYPFEKINSWGEIKTVDENWFTHAFYDEYVYLLDLLGITLLEDSKKIIDSLVSKMRLYFNERPTGNMTEFLEKYFCEYLLLRAYEDADSRIPAEIINNLGGNEIEVAFMVHATLSKIGITPKIYIEGDNDKHLYFGFEQSENLIYFSADRPKESGKEITSDDIIVDFLRFHVGKTIKIEDQVKIYELLEDIKPTTDVYRFLCKLYDKWSSEVESDALKQQYYNKMVYYLKKLPKDNPDDFYIIALREYNAKNLQEAWNSFNDLVSAYPDFTPGEGESPYFYLSRMASDKFAVGAIGETQLVGYLSKLDYEKKHHKVILNDCAYLLLDRQKFTESLQILNELEKRGDADVRMYLARSTIYTELKQLSESISNLKSAILLDEANRRIWAQLIQQLIDNEMYMDAYNECNKAAFSKAKMIYALKVGAEIAEQYINNLSLAAEMLAKYVQLNPDDEQAKKKLEAYLK